MTKFLDAFLHDESGAAAAEYALILAVVGAGIAFGAAYLGTQVNKALTGAGDKICPANNTLCAAAGKTS